MEAVLILSKMHRSQNAHAPSLQSKQEHCQVPSTRSKAVWTTAQGQIISLENNGPWVWHISQHKALWDGDAFTLIVTETVAWQFSAVSLLSPLRNQVSKSTSYDNQDYKRPLTQMRLNGKWKLKERSQGGEWLSIRFFGSKKDGGAECSSCLKKKINK